MGMGVLEKRSLRTGDNRPSMVGGQLAVSEEFR
jgi:hypothetical protein